MRNKRKKGSLHSAVFFWESSCAVTGSWNTLSSVASSRVSCVGPSVRVGSSSSCVRMRRFLMESDTSSLSSSSDSSKFLMGSRRQSGRLKRLGSLCVSLTCPRHLSEAPDALRHALPLSGASHLRTSASLSDKHTHIFCTLSNGLWLINELNNKIKSRLQ